MDSDCFKHPSNQFSTTYFLLASRSTALLMKCRQALEATAAWGHSLFYIDRFSPPGIRLIKQFASSIERDISDLACCNTQDLGLKYS
jgi:hypothetical protein